MEDSSREQSFCRFCHFPVFIRERKLPNGTHILFYLCTYCDLAFYFEPCQAAWLALDV